MLQPTAAHPAPAVSASALALPPAATEAPTGTPAPSPKRNVTWREAQEEDERAVRALAAEQEADGQSFLWAEDDDGHDDDDYMAATARQG